MQQYIHNLPLELVSHQVIGHTLQKRNLDLLTIGTGDRTVVVMARVHPGETPASFIMEGFLDFVTNQDCAHAAFLREKATLKIVPMLNPDGVALGNYRQAWKTFIFTIISKLLNHSKDALWLGTI